MTLKKLVGGKDNMDKVMRFLRFLPDDMYLRLMYRIGMKQKLNLKAPRTYTEKLQWLKLHDRKERYRQMADKYEAKKLIADIVGEEHVVPNLGVWDRFEDINFDKLPERFVLKCTHDSGSVSVCKNRSTWNKAGTQKKFTEALKHDYFWIGREWPYKGLKRRIIAEEYLEDPGQPVLKDYKIFCFDGQPRFILTVTGGHTNESETIRRVYTPEWQQYEVGLHGKEFVPIPEEKPEQLQEMLEMARKLSADMRHLRVDLYIAAGRIYVGELTFYHMTGIEKFSPAKYNDIFGEFIRL